MTRAGRWELRIIAALVIASAAAAWLLVRWAPVGLAGRYWSNPGWEGRPAAEANGTIPSRDELRRRLPGVRASFSAEWQGYLIVEQSGTHEFFLVSDDGSCLEIDGFRVIDNGGTHGYREATGTVALRAGVRRVKVRFFQAGGSAALWLAWRQPGQPRREVRIFDFAPTREDGLRQLRLGGFTRALSVALPVTWALLFLYIPVRMMIWFTGREIARLQPTPADRRALWWVLAAGVVLMAWGLGFAIGQPWVPDALGPAVVRSAYLSGFSHGWYDKYPTAYFAMLSIPMSAFEISDRLSILPVDGSISQAAQEVLFRLVSLLSGIGTLAVAYLCGAELYGVRRGVAAPVVLLLTPLFLYYGKTANLDVPSLLWFGWAMLGFVRLIKYNRSADYLLLGAAAAAAVATKDQHYANLALVPLGVLIVNARRQPAATLPGRLGRALVDRRLWLAGAAAAAVSLVLHNMIFNFSGFVAHVRELASYREVLPFEPATAAGYLALTVRTGELFAFGMGWAWVVAALTGIVLAVRRPADRWWLWLLLVPLSFHAAFTLVTRSVYDRYLFGGVFVLALFGGAALAELLEARRWRRIAAMLAVVLTGYSVLYAASVNVMMTRDARYEAVRWVQQHAGSGTVGLLRGRRYMPAFGPSVRTVTVPLEAAALTRLSPDLLVVNARMTSRYEAGRNLVQGLDEGSLEYREVFRYRAPMPAWALLNYTAAFTGSRESELTNLDKVNPEIVIYGRTRR